VRGVPRQLRGGAPGWPGAMARAGHRDGRRRSVTEARRGAYATSVAEEADPHSRRKRRIRLDGKHALSAKSKDKAWAHRLLKAAAAPHERKFLRVLDVARRIAGTGSLGVERYVVLVEGKGSPRQNYLLDLKAARPSATSVSLKAPQPEWPSEAERVVWVQSHMQAASPALLRAVNVEGRS